VRAATAWPTSSASGRDAGIEPFPLAAGAVLAARPIGTGYQRTVRPPARSAAPVACMRAAVRYRSLRVCGPEPPSVGTAKIAYYVLFLTKEHTPFEIHEDASFAEDRCIRAELPRSRRPRGVVLHDAVIVVLPLEGDAILGGGPTPPGNKKVFPRAPGGAALAL
jgi:hypothetical protein